MKKNLSALFAVLVLLASCSKKQDPVDNTTTANKVLMLKVDYLTNTFEGGKELSFSNTPASFTVSNQFLPPSDFGNLTLKYQELNEALFDGTIIWMGTGKINFPQNILAANQFNSVTTPGIVYPANGFQNVFNPSNNLYNYTNTWLSVQQLVKVRAYLNANPAEPVKIFLYTPSVGIGNPAEWDWIIFMKG